MTYCCGILVRGAWGPAWPEWSRVSTGRMADVERYAAALPDASLEVIAGAGHFAFLDKPEAVASAVLAFSGNKQNA